jgi:hypothetical protein
MYCLCPYLVKKYTRDNLTLSERLEEIIPSYTGVINASNGKTTKRFQNFLR